MIDRRLLALTRERWGVLALTTGLSLIGGFLLIAQAWLLSHLVTAIFLAGRSIRTLIGVLILFALVVAMRAVCVWGSDRSARALATQIKMHLRYWLSAHLFALGPLFTRTAASGELATTAVRGVEDMDDYFSQFLPQIATGMVLPIAIFAIITPLDPLSGLVLIVTVPVLPIFMALIGMATRSVSTAQFAALSQLSGHFLDVVQGLTTLKLFGRSRHQVQVVAQMSEELRRATMHVLRVAFLNALALELMATISTAIIAVEIGFRLLYGQIPFERAFFILLLAPEFYTPIRQISARFHAAMPGVAASKRIFEVLDMAAPENKAPQMTSFTTHLSVAPTSITFEDVSFTYPLAEIPTLAHLDLTLRVGERVSLVGASGAGKSTIAQLLLGFITPNEGSINVDAIPLTQISLESWRAQLAWSPPRPHLFAQSVAENIRLGRADVSDAEMKRAAQLAQVDSLIQSLPDGYETSLGEGGVQLSGGQAQRIALARALVREASILILDEALAQIDPWQAQQILAHLDAERHRRITLVIAHRLATARSADRILVLAEGHIQDSGSHAELLARCSTYQAFVAAETLREDALCVA